MPEYINKNDIKETGIIFTGEDDTYTSAQADGADKMWNKILSLPSVNAIPIPEGATNGDMVMAMFPNLKVKIEGTHITCWSDKHIWFTLDYDWWNSPYIQQAAPNHNEPEEHSCFKCRYLGWECVGDGMNPVCEQEPYIEDPSDNDSGLHKSEPTVGSKNDCYWFNNKEE